VVCNQRKRDEEMGHDCPIFFFASVRPDEGFLYASKDKYSTREVSRGGKRESEGERGR